MAQQAPTIDSVLIQWGNRLFYPGNQGVLATPENPSPLNRWKRLQALMRGSDCVRPKTATSPSYRGDF